VAKTGAGRQRGTVRKRGNSLQVTVYAGIDPLTGKRMFLSDSTTDPVEAERIRKRFVAQVDGQRSPRTRATFGHALESWLRTHEAEETTLEGYRGYVRRTIEPALGEVPIAKITPQVLEEFYADLRRVSAALQGWRAGRGSPDNRSARVPHCAPPASAGPAGS
jgi:integrase